MKDFIFDSHKQFTDEEVQKCIPIAKRMANLAILAREHGILSLDEYILDSDSDFLKAGVTMILSATQPIIINRVCSYAISSKGYTGADLLERLLISEGLIMIANPDATAKDVAFILGAMLGEEYILEF